MPATPATLMLGQENLPFPGETGTTTSTAPAGDAGAAPPQRGDPFGSQFLMIIFVALAALLIFSMLGQRRDRKKRDVMLSAIKKHDRVQTLGGVIGSIVDVNKDTVVLKVDESSNTRITFARSAITQVLRSGPAEPAAAGDDKT